MPRAEEALQRGTHFLEKLNSRSFSLAATSMRIYDNGGRTFSTREPKGKSRNVDYYVTVNPFQTENLFEMLRGTLITMEQFDEQMKQRRGITVGNADALRSNHYGNAENLTYSFTSQHFNLNVFHGSDIREAKEISQIATNQGFEDENIRTTYQNHINSVLEPIMGKGNEGKPQIWIQEDCAATLETQLAILGLSIHKLQLTPGRIIRIDVPVATPQAILLAQKFAEQNELNVEFNVGYLAPGLSEGKYDESEKVYEGACYIMNKDLTTFAVGDIGNGGQQTGLEPWDNLRNDNATIVQLPVITSDGSYIFRILRGGAFIGSLYDYYHEGTEVLSSEYTIVQFFGSRTHDREKGSGVAIFIGP